MKNRKTEFRKRQTWKLCSCGEQFQVYECLPCKLSNPELDGHPERCRDCHMELQHAILRLDLDEEHLGCGGGYRVVQKSLPREDQDEFSHSSDLEEKS